MTNQKTLKAVLKENGYTLQDTAKALGIAYTTLWRKMGYQNFWKINELEELSKLTGLTINELSIIRQR